MYSQNTFAYKLQSENYDEWIWQTEDAINSNTLIKYATKYNKYIDDDVDIIGGNLSAAVHINIESLLILEVHGK